MKKLRDPLLFYREVISEEFVNALLLGSGVAPRAGIFTAIVVIWLMICQRLNPKRSLAAAVELLRTCRELELLSLAAGSIRARNKRVSKSTGGYSQARRRLPVSVVEEVADRLNSAVMERRDAGKHKNVYVIDGSTLQVAHTPDNIARYPQFLNQHGKAHYPLVRICVATEASSGVTARPAFGPFNGAKAVSELQLADEVLARLPRGSVVIGDRYFGCFNFVTASKANNHEVVCRMKVENAARVLGYTPKGQGEQAVFWSPSPHECKKYPHLAQTEVRGKIVWSPLTRPGYRKELLVLFSTLAAPSHEIRSLYALRWNVETDLRDIKTTLGMNFIDAHSPEMIAKEIILGVCAFNLIRLMIDSAASAAKIKARRFSFTAVLGCVHAIASTTFEDPHSPHLQKVIQRALSDIKGLLLPIRGSPRYSEPRKVWPRGGRKHFFTTSRKAEKAKLRSRNQTKNENN